MYRSCCSLFHSQGLSRTLNAATLPTQSVNHRQTKPTNMSLGEFGSLGASRNLRMGEEAEGSVRVSDSNGGDHTLNDDQSRQLDIYPLSCYYFGSKEAIPFKNETLDDRVQRLNSNYAAYGLRTCVEAVMLVELFKHPHILLLQVRNCIFKLPGGRLRPGELEIDGLKRKLSRKLCVNADGDGIAWEVGECLDVWWRPDFETLPCRDLPSTVRSPKERTKLFLVKLPESRKFIVPKNLKLLAIPLCQINKNRETYGPIISGVPEMLSKFTINIVEA